MHLSLSFPGAPISLPKKAGAYRELVIHRGHEAAFYRWSVWIWLTAALQGPSRLRSSISPVPQRTFKQRCWGLHWRPFKWQAYTLSVSCEMACAWSAEIPIAIFYICLGIHVSRSERGKNAGNGFLLKQAVCALQGLLKLWFLTSPST